MTLYEYERLRAEHGQLTARVAELEAALRPFARAEMPPEADDDSPCVNHLFADSEPLVGDFRRAAEVWKGE